jgi:hypothetical protein
MDILQVQLDRCRKDSVVYVHVELSKEHWPFAFASDAFVETPQPHSWTCVSTGDPTAPLRKVLLQCSHADICVMGMDKGVVGVHPFPPHIFVPFGSLVFSLPVATNSLPRRAMICIEARTPPNHTWSKGVPVVTTSRSRDARTSPIELVHDWCERPTSGTCLSTGDAQCSDICVPFLLHKAPTTHGGYSLMTSAMVEKRVSDMLLRLVEN